MQDPVAHLVPLDPLGFLAALDHQDRWSILKQIQHQLFQAPRALQEPLVFLESQDQMDLEGREVCKA